MIPIWAKSDEKDLLQAFGSALEKVHGAYSLIALGPRGLIAAKDPRGFRPLCLGEVDGAYVVSSETCGLDAIGAEFVREIDQGEMVQVILPGVNGDKPSLRFVIGEESHKQSLCVFEFIYFARPDSDIYDLNVHRARKRLGRKLASKDPVEADLVMGVPDSSLSASIRRGSRHSLRNRTCEEPLHRSHIHLPEQSSGTGGEDQLNP